MSCGELCVAEQVGNGNGKDVHPSPPPLNGFGMAVARRPNFNRIKFHTISFKLCPHIMHCIIMFISSYYYCRRGRERERERDLFNPLTGETQHCPMVLCKLEQKLIALELFTQLLMSSFEHHTCTCTCTVTGHSTT